MATKQELQVSIKDLHSEAFSLELSFLFIFYEIDISDLLFDMGLIGSLEGNEDQRIFRFHNNTKLINTNLIWQGKTYIACPIRTEGFEFSARGTLPVPKMSISVQSEGINALAILKNQIKLMGDLVGAKVTRKRTLLKYLDSLNIFNGLPSAPNTNPDPNAHFPDDIFYVERKSFENSTMIEYELATILDLEGVKLPGRLVLNNRCPWTYRGEGCLYESVANRENEVHGANTTLLTIAPPVANDKDELIIDILKEKDLVPSPNIKPANPLQWDKNKVYAIGEYTFIEKNKIKYYFVCRSTNQNNPQPAPPHTTYWIQDACSKSIQGCKLRWGKLPSGLDSEGKKNTNNVHLRCLPFGGFPGTVRGEPGAITYLR